MRCTCSRGNPIGESSASSHAVVAVGVIRRDAALIDPKDVHVFPVEVALGEMLKHQPGVEPPETASVARPFPCGWLAAARSSIPSLLLRRRPGGGPGLPALGRGRRLPHGSGGARPPVAVFAYPEIRHGIVAAIVMTSLVKHAGRKAPPDLRD